jgi:hypothetical protein
MSLILSSLVLLCPLLTEQMGHPRFPVRARASARLSALGLLAVPALEGGLSHPDPEVRRRCAILLEPYREQMAKRDALKFPCPPFWEQPWFQGLLERDPELERFWSHSDVWNCRGDELSRRRLMTHLWLEAQLLMRRPRGEILDNLRRMQQAYEQAQQLAP